jgi:hypothetical protein
VVKNARTWLPARGGRRAPAIALDTAEVRQRARAQGIKVKDRGRIPAELVVRFPRRRPEGRTRNVAGHSETPSHSRADERAKACIGMAGDSN